MSMTPAASRFLSHEARALLTRLARVRPFALQIPSVPAAAVSLAAQSGIERFLSNGRRRLRGLVRTYLEWLASAEGRRAEPSDACRRFTLLRLRFHGLLAQFDIFADVLAQRAEHDTGIWLAGLDSVAADALTLPGRYYSTPPVICYLQRGIGASIRRARTRLPGGGENPVAIIQMPLERMIGSGIASSLVHEVGHQGAALLGLNQSLRPVLRRLQGMRSEWRFAWHIWERWLSEIISDFWSVARVGIASTIGLMGVVSLPRAFVFRFDPDDPHPTPWIRVKLSCAMGHALYPHPQWENLGRLWETFYPLNGLNRERKDLFSVLEKTTPALVTLLTHHRPPALRGASLLDAMAVSERQPARLAAYHEAWRKSPALMRTAAPSLVFAVIGQAKADGKMTPEEESRVLDAMLRYWALRDTLNVSAVCAALVRPKAAVLAA
jgi:hypothetical protein